MADDLFALARSPRWEDRRTAAAGLAGLESPEASAALLNLLRDPRDTGVVQEAAESLIAQGNSRAADLICAAIATADEDISDHLLYFVARQREKLEASGLRSLLEARRSSLDADVRSGAAELTDYIGWSPRDD